MPLDHYITLGRSGLRVSPLCLGTMTFGLDWGWGTEVDDSKKIIDAYLDRGGNFLDTANIYTKGHSEKIIGDHLAATPGKRDRIVLATKCTGNMFPGDPNAGGGGRKSLIAAVEESLRRLRTDYIDLLWAHFWDEHTPMEEMLRTVDDLVRAGKVRYFGLSDHPAWVCAVAQQHCTHAGYTPIVGLQIEYSLRQRTVEGELIPMARELGMGVTPWSPLAGGILTGKHTKKDGSKKDDSGGDDESKRDWMKITDRDEKIVAELEKVAGELETSPAQVALAWVRGRPGVTSTIIGARTMGQLESNLGSLDVELSGEQTGRLDEVSAVEQAFPHGFVAKIRTAIQNGTTVNGDTREVFPMSPKDESERH